MDFSNKNVLITGGSRGIGRACAMLFAELKANVIFTYHENYAEAEKTLNTMLNYGKHKFYKLDISNDDNVEEFCNLIMSEYDTIDVLVNNAGIYFEQKITEASYSEWKRNWSNTIHTNLVGPANLTYFISRFMIQNGGGKIVNISSRGAFRGEPENLAYGASKAGLNSFSQSLAQFLAPFNITVGVVAPGFVDTDMAGDIMNSSKGDEINKQSPLNRIATADEVARAVAVFASDGFEYMTGSIIDLNGASYLR